MARKLKEYPRISLDPEKIDVPLDFTALFGRPGSVHIEIGTGKATFLVSQAKAEPRLNFLGIEWASKYYRWAVDRLGRHGLANVRVVRADAADFIRRHIPDDSVACLHIYFPDPWPKRRHHKRRLFQSHNVTHLVRCLAPTGRINLATDHAEYLRQIKAVMAAFDNQLTETEFIRPAAARPGEYTGTNYERKYLKQDRPIYTAAWKKTSSSF